MSECSCDECINMCKRFPCRPLPEEIAAMPDDVQARLMLQHDGNGMGGIPHLQPAVVGEEGSPIGWDYDAWWGTIGNPGRCTFLTEDGLCELHDKCKPYEGRVSFCSSKRELDTFSRSKLEDAWDCDEGQAVVGAWREKFGHETT